MSLVKTYIIIDDEPASIFIIEALIKKERKDSAIVSFTNAADGLAYIKKNYSEESDNRTVLFLDLEMPEMNGYEFIEEFIRISEVIRKQIKMIVLSSVMEARNIKFSSTHSCVSRFISKPLTAANLNAIDE